MMNLVEERLVKWHAWALLSFGTVKFICLHLIEFFFLVNQFRMGLVKNVLTVCFT